MSKATKEFFQEGSLVCFKYEEMGAERQSVKQQVCTHSQFICGERCGKTAGPYCRRMTGARGSGKHPVILWICISPLADVHQSAGGLSHFEQLVECLTLILCQVV